MGDDMGRIGFTLAVLSLISTSNAYADEAEQKEQVVVTATRLPQPQRETGSDVTIIDEKEIKRRGATFVVDVLRGRLFMTDPELKKTNARMTYWKTGHSYMKRRTHELKALAGFEKSGHFFFNAPIGRGYDDGLVSAIAVCEMLDRAPGKTMADLKDALPKTWSSPTMSPHCADEAKYGIVDKVVKHFEAAKSKGEKVAGQAIRDLVTVNGVRVVLEDGSWGLVRASSNKPELVVVVESPVAEQRMRDMFEAMDSVLRTHPEVGEYNQKI